MKTIALCIILALVCNIHCLAQLIPKSDIVNAAMPRGATKLSKEQTSKYVHSNYKVSQISGDHENTYQIDGLLISFWDLTVDPAFKKSLKDSQKEALSYLGRNNENVINRSEIIIVNNIEFLIVEYQKSDEVYLRFQSDYNKDNKNICGLIQFKKPDQEKAQKTLLAFLDSVHFK